MTISGFVAYVKQAWKNKPDASTPISAERLLHMESGIKGNSDAIEKLAAAVVNQIVNDPNKIASMAALFAVNEKLAELNSDIATSSLLKVNYIGGYGDADANAEDWSNWIYKNGNSAWLGVFAKPDTGNFQKSMTLIATLPDRLRPKHSLVVPCGHSFADPKYAGVAVITRDGNIQFSAAGDGISRCCFSVSFPID